MSMPCVCHFVAVAAASFSGWSIRTTQKVHCCSMFSAFRGDCTHSANSNDFVQLKYLSKNKRKVVCNGRNSKFREAPSAPTPLRAHIICSCVRYGAVIYVMAHLFVWHGSFIHVSRLMWCAARHIFWEMVHAIHSRVRCDSPLCVTRLIL